MADKLKCPFSKEELHKALLLMAKGHSPVLDGVTTKFFCRFWDLIGKKIQMIQELISHGHLPIGMTSGIIVLIFKVGDYANLSNWRPITLLDVSYKIVAQALQIRLQNLLKDVISPKQTTFLPSRHIFSNILLQYKSVHWAHESNQDLIFLKLDFTKAYDIVSWNFLCKVMAKLGISDSFSEIVFMLLSDASTTVFFNGKATCLFHSTRR